MTVVIGTAGHIDHGKTTLLRALTGIDADRLPEERARGMTIDVGYAHLALDDGTEIDFVDVPGHDRLVGNMLVGAGEIDAAMVVVAADDGPRAQTIEHVSLLDALQIRHGVAVVTKADVADAERVEAVARDVRAVLANTSMAGIPVVAVSASTGEGIADLRQILADVHGQVAGRAPASPTGADGSDPLARLAVDRVFAIRGRGTVVTGTLRGGAVVPGARLRVVPGHGAEIRVREIQVHGRPVEIAGPGRVAFNVVGQAGPRRLTRGVVLTADPAVVAVDRVLVALRPVGTTATVPTAASAAVPPDRSRFVLHLGTDHVGATVGRAGREAIELPDGEVAAILRMDRPIATATGDRFVLRRPSSAPVGGRILDTEPARGVARRRATPARIAALASAEPGSSAWIAARLDLHGATLRPPAVAADVVDLVDAAILQSAHGAGQQHEARRSQLVAAGAAVLRRNVGPLGDSRGRGRSDAASDLVGDRVDALIAAGRLVAQNDRISLPGAAIREPSAAELAAMDRLVERLAVVAPPPLLEAARAVGCAPAAVRELERSNRIVRLEDDLAWAFETYRDLAGRALDMAMDRPLTPAAYRDATGTSRKYVMAILEDLDRRALLRRTPEGHVPGPRAPSRSKTIAGSATASSAEAINTGTHR